MLVFQAKFATLALRRIRQLLFSQTAVTFLSRTTSRSIIRVPLSTPKMANTGALLPASISRAYGDTAVSITWNASNHVRSLLWCFEDIISKMTAIAFVSGLGLHKNQ